MNQHQSAWVSLAVAFIGCVGVLGCSSPRNVMNSTPGAPDEAPADHSGGKLEHLTIGGGALDIEFHVRSLAVNHDQLIAWIRSAADGVTTYFDHYPVKRVRIEVTQEDDDEIHGVTYDGKLIRMRVGKDVTPAELADDWTLTHEMFHLAFPSMGDNHPWMNEGLSVYLEPIARARIGVVSVDRYWQELVEGLPTGQPEAGEGGLDQTHTWARTYWGGTLFWFEADLRIRQQSHNHKSLDDVIRAILAAGGDGSQDWSVKQVIDTANRATGTTVLQDVYSEMAPKADHVDLTADWKALGVIYKDGKVLFDNHAPLADVRRGMLEPITKRNP